MKIAVLQKYNSKVESLADIATTNKLWYAERNQYEFVNDTTDYILEQGRSDTWLIELSILNVIKTRPDIDWIFWTDIDSLIMNYEVKLEDLISQASDEENIIACMWSFIQQYTYSDLSAPTIKIENKPSQWFFLHTGNFLVRNCEWSYEFLSRLYNDQRFIIQPELRDHIIGDEMGITTYYLGYPEVRKHIKILSNQIFLSIPVLGNFKSTTVKIFEKGDFIFHVPVQPLEVKEAQLSKYIPLCEKSCHA